MIKPAHVFTLVCVFWFVWIYSEVTEYRSAQKYRAKVDEFMHQGGRYTKAEGDALKVRVERLEAQIWAMQLEDK